MADALSRMQPIIISRFLVNLRRADNPGSMTSTVGHLSRFSTPRFRVPTITSIIGDMDRPLDHGPSPEEEADVWEIERTSGQVSTNDGSEGGITQV